MIIRPIVQTDLDALQQIAIESGPGFTSLVNDRDILAAKIARSIDSFQRPISEPGDEGYLFVLEDPQTGDIMGTTGIEAAVGLTRPLYHYHHSQMVHHSRELGLYKRVDVLNLCNHYTGCSEICTLFLRPQYRRKYAGKLLSLVRFLFMAQHPDRFAPTVIAEMRGVCSAHGQSPFWDWLRAHFIDLDFATVTGLIGAGNNGFITELMPRCPLYCQLLSDEARAVIGRVHPQTEPALRILEAEGFRHLGYVDPIDAGPTVEAELSKIHTVASSVICPVDIVDAASRRHHPRSPGTTVLLANTSVGEFRATITDLATYRADDNCLLVPASVALALGLRSGGTARFTELMSKSGTGAGGGQSIAGEIQNGSAKEPQYAYR